MLPIPQQFASRLALASICFGAIIVYGSYANTIFHLAIRYASKPSLPLIHPQAQSENQLAIDYATGQGVALDRNKAVALIIQSAQHGYDEAQFRLGDVYYQGVPEQHINQDYRKAYIWFSLAAHNGYSKAASLRYEVSAYLSPAELMAAQTVISRLLEKQAQD